MADAALATARAASQENMPRNVIVRLELLAQGARQASAGQLDHTAYLRFFSQTRQLFWEAGPRAGAIENMRVLEQNALRFASQHKFSLDLPPVGTSPAVALPPPTQAPPSSVGEVQFTREALVQSAQRTDELAQALWGAVKSSPQTSGDSRARRDLAGVAEAARGMRLAVEQGGDPGPHYQALLTNRARFLFSGPDLRLDEALRAQARQLTDQMDILVGAYRQLGSSR